MKKEVMAISLLAVILILSLINISVMGSRMEVLTSDIDQAQEYAKSGQVESAAHRVEASLKTWESWAGYTHIMLRHSEIEMITDAYYELLTELQEGNNPAPARYSWLKSLLADMTAKESITIQSVF